jgi:hypothetical protein
MKPINTATTNGFKNRPPSVGFALSSKIQPWHLDRLAAVYVRQSTSQQAAGNRESTDRLPHPRTARPYWDGGPSRAASRRRPCRRCSSICDADVGTPSPGPKRRSTDRSRRPCPRFNGRGIDVIPTLLATLRLTAADACLLRTPRSVVPARPIGKGKTRD